MIRVHREPLVPLFLFDLLPVPGRGEERNDNARTSPTVEDESESGRRDVPARRCGGYRTQGFAVVLTKRETHEHDHAESFPYFDRRTIPDTVRASSEARSESREDAEESGVRRLRRN